MIVTEREKVIVTEREKVIVIEREIVRKRQTKRESVRERTKFREIELESVYGWKIRLCC